MPRDILTQVPLVLRRDEYEQLRRFARLRRGCSIHELASVCHRIIAGAVKVLAALPPDELADPLALTDEERELILSMRNPPEDPCADPSPALPGGRPSSAGTA